MITPLALTALHFHRAVRQWLTRRGVRVKQPGRRLLWLPKCAAVMPSELWQRSIPRRSSSQEWGLHGGIWPSSRHEKTTAAGLRPALSTLTTALSFMDLVVRFPSWIWARCALEMTIFTMWKGVSSQITKARECATGKCGRSLGTVSSVCRSCRRRGTRLLSLRRKRKATK